MNIRVIIDTDWRRKYCESLLEIASNKYHE